MSGPRLRSSLDSQVIYFLFIFCESSIYILNFPFHELNKHRYARYGNGEATPARSLIQFLSGSDRYFVF